MIVCSLNPIKQHVQLSSFVFFSTPGRTCFKSLSTSWLNLDVFWAQTYVPVGHICGLNIGVL